MTLEEFFAALEKTPRDWAPRDAFDRIAVRRCGTFCVQCPLTAVAGFGERLGFWTYADPGHWIDAARVLGLRPSVARRIINAADGRGRLRDRLLAACGVAGAER